MKVMSVNELIVYIGFNSLKSPIPAQAAGC